LRTIHVLSVLDFREDQLQKLRAVDPCLVIVQRPCISQDEVSGVLDERTEVLCGWGTLPDDISAAANLRWVQVASAGVNGLLEHPIMQNDVMLTNASGIHATWIAEYVLAMMVNLVRRWHQLLFLKWGHGWPQDRGFALGDGEIWGKTIGIVGYGSVGREVARLCQSYGMRVLAVKRDPGDLRDCGYCLPGRGDREGRIPEVVDGPEGLIEMLPQCDYVLVSAPLTRATEGLIGATELAAMKPTAYFINIARGELVDEQALTEALRQGRIAGAALDVFSQEPLPPANPLWDVPNVIMTPHISGASPVYNDYLVELFAENLRRYAAEQTLLNLVDKDRQY
jgi:phosphoglycerate dehydrogenase-like enzyme